VYALRAAASVIAEETLEKTVQRHKDSALRLHDGLEKMGLKLFVKNPV